MDDTEIGALRQKLASRARSDDYRQRRKDMNARALEYKIAPDVTVPASALCLASPPFGTSAYIQR
jgi:hypothetical protein